MEPSHHMDTLACFRDSSGVLAFPSWAATAKDCKAGGLRPQICSLSVLGSTGPQARGQRAALSPKVPEGREGESCLASSQLLSTLCIPQLASASLQPASVTTWLSFLTVPLSSHSMLLSVCMSKMSLFIRTQSLNEAP